MCRLRLYPPRYLPLYIKQKFKQVHFGWDLKFFAEAVAKETSQQLVNINLML